MGKDRRSIDEYFGKKYGYLTILSEVPTMKNKLRKVVCQCDCGTQKEILLSDVISGRTKSCGCFRKEILKKQKTKHGKSESRLYFVWTSIKERCFNHNNPSYPKYGGRGITICQEWLNFNAFEKWAYENGYDENAEYGECTLDRINVDGIYEPNNCRWTDTLVQGNNKRNNQWVTYNGETHTIAQWAKKLGMNYTTLFCRLKKHHWPVEDALTIAPVVGKNRS